MPAEKPVSKYYRSRQGAMLPLELRQSPLEYKRRIAGMEFRQGRADVHSFPDVKTYLTRVIDNYEDRFGNDDAVLEAWQKVRVSILEMDSLNNSDFLKTSKKMTDQFDLEYFTDSKGKYLEESFRRLQPAITEITHIVAKGK